MKITPRHRPANPLQGTRIERRHTPQPSQRVPRPSNTKIKKDPTPNTHETYTDEDDETL